jgi:hypothetical protein
VPVADMARVNGTVHVLAEGYPVGDHLPLLDESDLA